MKTTTMLAFGLAFAVLSSAVYADSHITDYGEHCTSSVSDDAFDGAIATMACFSDKTGISIGAVCRNGETNAQILIGRYVLERGLILRMALDGVETPEWTWSIGTSNKALFIKPPIPTLKEVSKHASLRIRIVEMDGDTHNAEIDISRFAEAITLPKSPARSGRVTPSGKNRGWGSPRRDPRSTSSARGSRG